MSDLVAWLRGCLDEDERVAREAGGGTWSRNCGHVGTDDEPLPPGHDSCAVVAGDDIHIYDEGGHGPAQAEHIARHDPARVLAEVAAKRAILDLHYPIHRNTGWTEDGDERYAELEVCGHCVPKHSHFNSRDDVPTYPCPTVRLLAQPCAGRDGWREEWRV